MQRSIFRRATIETLESRCLLAYGDIDTEFGQRVYTLDFEREFDDYVFTAAPYLDGATLMAGTSEGRGTLLRMLPDGTLDTGFDQDGIAHFILENAERTEVTYLKPLSDGSILMIGQLSFAAEGRPFVAKVSETGELDTTYGDQGLWLGRVNTRALPFDSETDELYLIEAESINTTEFRGRKFVVAKLTEAGQLETSFGTEGRSDEVVAQNTLSGSVSEAQFRIHSQDGLNFGFVIPVSNDSRELRSVRFTLDGQLDSNFAGDGIAEIDVGDMFLAKWYYQGAGDFIALEPHQPLDFRVRAQKINVLHGIDAQFGQLEFPLSEEHYSFGNGLSLGKLSEDTFQASWIAADRATNTAVIYSASFNSQGTINTDYGTAGIHQTPHPARTALVTGSNPAYGSHLLIGTTEFPRDFSVFQLDSAGELQQSFGITGHAQFDLTQPTTRIHAFEIHGDGSSQYFAFSKPELGGVRIPGQQYRGDLNTGYLSTAQIPYDGFSFAEGRSHLLGSGISVLAQHASRNGGYAIVLDFFEPSGARRISDRIEIEAPYFIDSFEFVDLPDGSVLMVADAYGSQAQSDGLGYAILAKLSSDGKLVTEFADQGVKRFPPLENRVAQVIPVDDGFRVILSNRYANDGFDDMFVMAIDANADTIFSFGTNGIIEVLDDVNRKRHVVGTKTDRGLLLLINTEANYKFLRVNDDGTVDQSFGIAGLKDAPLTDTDQLNSVDLVWSDDDLVFGATVGDLDAYGEVLVTDSAGEPNSEFGTSGLVTLNLGPFSDRLTSLVSLVDGSILVGMESRSESGPHGLVLRLDGPNPSKRPWHNIYDPLNVSAALGDKIISPLDSLLVVNYLNSGGTPGGFVDTNGDGSVTPLDVLLVINHLNRLGGSGEGEPSVGTMADWGWTWDATSRPFLRWMNAEDLDRRKLQREFRLR